MANTKISELIENTTPVWSEEFVYALNGTNGKIILNTVKTFVQPDLSSYATLTDLASKQDTLVSWVNIKTVNGNSIIWTWNINTYSSYTEYNYSAMQWPSSAWFHIPTDTEWDTIHTMGVTLWAWLSNAYWWKNFATYLKMPYSWNRTRDSSVWQQWTRWHYRTCIGSWDSAEHLTLADTSRWLSGWYKSMWYSIRCFKDSPSIPDSWWTTIFDWSWTAVNAWIFHDTVNWLISISDNWEDWITIQDKNIWATVVYNYWDALSSSNCWNYYQWWNNYWFAYTWALTTDWNQVDTTWYWPWNYYSSSTFITRISSPYDWSSVDNNDLRGWVTWVVLTEYDIYNRFQLSWTNITIWGQAVWWMAWDILSWSYSLITWNNNFVWQEHYLYIPTQTNNYSLTTWTWVSNPFNLTLPSSTKKACLVKFYCDGVWTMVISDCKIAS